MFRSTATWCTLTRALRLHRAPGQPQVVFAVEPHTDMIAHEMGIDPYALRLRNVLQDGQVCATGGRYKHVRASNLASRRRSRQLGAPKSGPYVGRGISLGQRPQDRACTRSPSAWMSMPG